ncbi:MAG: SPOR domain-containing protein, partial [Gammaproteobacteria bacterium]|nr:SPOR domain-containing protein [Gammaproteobacteria bacterium]
MRAAAAPESQSPASAAGSIFVQVGAFGDVDNARRRYRQLRDGGVGPLRVHEDASPGRTLYRVRVGPIANVAEYDSIVAQL